MHIKVLSEKRGAKVKEANALLETARTAKRELNADELTKLEGIQGEVELIDRNIQAEMRAMSQNATKSDNLTPAEKRDVERFSLSRLIALRAASQPLDGAEAEFVAHGAREAREAGVSPQGLMIPSVVLRNTERRDLTATGTTSTTLDQGGMTIATEKGTLQEALFERLVLAQAGATVLTNLVGNIDLPRIVKGTEPSEKAENAQATEYTPTTAMLSLTPNRLPTVMEVSAQLMRQSGNRSLDAFLQNHLASLLRVRMEKKAIHGDGNNNTPVGILATTGIGAVYAGGAAADNTNATGAAPVWADIVNLEKEVAIDDADVGALHYLSNPAVRGKLKQTAKLSSTDSMMILDDRAGGLLNGYAPLWTNCVSRTLAKGGSGNVLSAIIFGNFRDLVLATWGGIDLLINPYSKDDYGLIRINAAVFYSAGVVRPESFAAGDDFST